MPKFKCGHEAAGHNIMKNRDGRGYIGTRCRKCYNKLKRKHYQPRLHLFDKGKYNASQLKRDLKGRFLPKDKS
jgi:hypothetical protein